MIETNAPYTMSAVVELPFDEAVLAVREALGEQGFGVLTEIDLAWTLKSKLGVDLPPQVILGACRAELAYQAVLEEPSVATLLPCNVVVRHLGREQSAVEALDPGSLMRLANSNAVRAVADDARRALSTALERLSGLPH